MSLHARITEVQQTPDGGTWFTFQVYDGDTVIVTHAQGIAPMRERRPEPRTRVVPKRKDDGSGDVIFEPDAHSYGAPQPVMVEEDYIEMVETGNVLPADADTIAEAIRNFMRDIVPLRHAEPSVSVGDTFEL